MLTVVFRQAPILAFAPLCTLVMDCFGDRRIFSYSGCRDASAHGAPAAAAVGHSIPSQSVDACWVYRHAGARGRGRSAAFGFRSLARSLSRSARLYLHAPSAAIGNLLAVNVHIRIKHAPTHPFLLYSFLNCSFARRED